MCISDKTNDSRITLTPELWSQWVHAVYPEPSVSYEFKYHEGSSFEKLSQSREIVENFMKWPLVLQKRTTAPIILDDESHELMSSFARIRYQLQEKYPNVIDWICAADKEIYEGLYRVSPFMSNLLRLKIAEFCDFQSYYTRTDNQRRLDRMVPYCWTVLHGERDLLEVLSVWIDNEITHELNDFINLLEDWEQFKSYPDDWALSLLNSTKDESDKSVEAVR